MKPVTFAPIGVVEAAGKYRFEAPRQAVFADNTGIIRLLPHHNFETALRDMNGFDRIWVLFCFHQNLESGWKPAVTPPVIKDRRKIGVFATRSPHRPNPIGMSCVELVKIDKLEIHIRNFDMLDGTWVLDIKPYIPAADSFPDAAIGWLPDAIDQYEVEFAALATEKIALIKDLSGLDLEAFAKLQLSYEPLNDTRKRIIPEDKGHSIGCRTWRICFTVDEHRVKVTDIRSNYSPSELLPEAEDRYCDKDIHRQFLKKVES